jgi:hypothetical protein
MGTVLATAWHFTIPCPLRPDVSREPRKAALALGTARSFVLLRMTASGEDDGKREDDGKKGNGGKEEVG